MRKDDQDLNAMAALALSGKVSREDYKRVARAVERERSTEFSTPVPDCGHPWEKQRRYVFDGPITCTECVPSVEITVEGEAEAHAITVHPSIPWRWRCADYANHRSQHIVRNGYALCLTCGGADGPQQALTVTVDADSPIPVPEA